MQRIYHDVFGTRWLDFYTNFVVISLVAVRYCTVDFLDKFRDKLICSVRSVHSHDERPPTFSVNKKNNLFPKTIFIVASTE